MLAPLTAALVSGAALHAREARADPPSRGKPTLQTPGPKRDAEPARRSDDAMVAAGVKLGEREIDGKPVPGGTSVQFNLNEAELPEVVAAISQITGKRFIYGAKLRSIKATVVSPSDTKVTADEAYGAFLSILATNGMTVIPHGRFLKIVETPGVASDVTPVYASAEQVPDEDRYVTRLHRLAHVDATETSQMLGKFKSKDGDVTAYAPGNLLILTDTGANIRRMLHIVEEIDVGGAAQQLWVEPINYSSATELANKLNDILDLRKAGAGSASSAGGKGAPSGSSGGPHVVADDRGNSLVITATEPEYLRMLELIKRLDVKPSGDGEIHVLPLQHASCKDLAQTLNTILGTGSTAATPARPGGAPGASGASVPGTAGAGIDQVFEGRVRMTCDEATNSIVTTSSSRDYAQLHAVIDKLDHPRRQVFIEAVVMDVSVSRVGEWGISYNAGGSSSFGSAGQGVIFGGNNIVNSISPSNLLSDSNSLSALAIGVQGPAISGSSNIFGTGLSIPSLGFVLHAMAQDGDNNVLATPHVLALDNQEATISIGENIPLQTNVGGGLSSLASSASGTSGLSALTLLGGGGGFSAPRQDVGTKIKVKPHVNDSDQIRLELSEEISDAGAPTGALGAIPINKRTAETQLVVKDQQTIVVGGLVRDALQNGETKIPFLGDIPILGYLFKQKTTTKSKSNLLLVITPYVIRSPDDLRAIFERKMQERQEFIDRYFVFSEGTSWSPPKDYRRSNGLLEEIRQSMLAEDQRARLELESRRPPERVHRPGVPIPIPMLGAPSRGAEAAPGAPSSPATPPSPAAPSSPASPSRRGSKASEK